MNYIKIDEYDTANGKGIGTVLWVAGCSHNCLECHNPQTHNPNNGIQFTSDTLEQLIQSLEHPYVTRLTLSGGDPLFPANRVPITQIVFNVKLRVPKIKIWLYTGYTYEDIKHLVVLDKVDYLVDGKFELSKRDLNLDFRGSSNQRIFVRKDNKLCELDKL